MELTINIKNFEIKEIPSNLKEKWKQLDVLEYQIVKNYYIFIGEMLCIIFDNVEKYVEIIQAEGSAMHSNIEFKVGTKENYFYYHYEGSVDENLHGYNTYVDEGYFIIFDKKISISFENRSADVIEILGINQETAQKIIDLRNDLFV